MTGVVLTACECEVLGVDGVLVGGLFGSFRKERSGRRDATEDVRQHKRSEVLAVTPEINREVDSSSVSLPFARRGADRYPNASRCVESDTVVIAVVCDHGALRVRVALFGHRDDNNLLGRFAHRPHGCVLVVFEPEVYAHTPQKTRPVGTGGREAAHAAQGLRQNGGDVGTVADGQGELLHGYLLSETTTARGRPFGR